MTTLADGTMIEDVFAVSDRLDALLKAAAAVLPKPKFDEDRVLATLAREGLRGALRMLIAVEPLIQFCESELLPALVDGAADLDTVVKREALKREEEPKTELPKSENEKPVAEVKPEPPKPAEQKEIPKQKKSK